MSRKNAREIAFKLTFEYLFSNTVNNKTVEMLCLDKSLTEEDKQYIDAVYNGVVEHFDEFSALIDKYAAGFKLERIYKPDLAVLLFAIYEIEYMPDIPNAVTINEAIELVKAYSDKKSYSFVHGILTSVIKEVNNGNN